MTVSDRPWAKIEVQEKDCISVVMDIQEGRMVGCRRCAAGVVRRLERHFRCGTSTWEWGGGQFSGIADVEHDVERTNIVG